MDLRRANATADDIELILSGVCDQIEIVGSIRRRDPNVKDIELVCVPSPGVPPIEFGMKNPPRHRLDKQIADLIATGYWYFDPNNRNNGPKYKRLWHKGANVGVDLFITTPHQFGLIMAIRTGDEKFSKQLVTDRTKGGLMLPGWKVRDGEVKDEHGNVVHMPTERYLFDRLGIPFINPKDRNLTTAQAAHRALGVAVARDTE